MARREFPGILEMSQMNILIDKTCLHANYKKKRTGRGMEKSQLNIVQFRCEIDFRMNIGKFNIIKMGRKND